MITIHTRRWPLYAALAALTGVTCTDAHALDELFYAGDGAVPTALRKGPAASDTVDFSSDISLVASDTPGTASQGESVSFYFLGPSSSGSVFDLSFTAPAGQLLQAGNTYRITEGGLSVTYPLTTALMTFVGNGVSEPIYSGYFKILELTGTLQPDGSGLTSFAADFDVIDGGGTLAGSETIGSIRYHSSIPVPSVPEPTEVLILAGGFVAIQSLDLYRRRRQSVR